MKKNITYLIFFLILLSCNYSCSQNYLSTNQLELDPITVNTENQHRAYFASGCFWCVEAIYESLIGVSDVISGYSGGDLANPTYELVNTRLTGHAETIEVVYNPNEITFSNLLKVYFGSQNIEQINGQGPDKGPQYRSIIFYQNKEQKDLIEKSIYRLQKKFDKKIFTYVRKFDKFYKAEKIHQDYYQIKFLNYLRYKKACGRDKVLDKIWN